MEPFPKKHLYSISQPNSSTPHSQDARTSESPKERNDPLTAGRDTAKHPALQGGIQRCD
jgi:hypothetical protein